MKWQLLRVATAVVLVLIVVMLYRLVRPAERGPEEVKLRPDEMTVAAAISNAGTREVAVRGFAFDGGGTGLRLCQAKVRHDPPRCRGPFLDVHGVARDAFRMKRGTDLKRRVYWAPDAVTLLGTVSGTRMDVTQVLD